jgi:hypothetical protein
MIATMNLTAKDINDMDLDEIFLTAKCRIVNQVNEAVVNKYYSNKTRKPKK